jgi:hypothetical protein
MRNGRAWRSCRYSTPAAPHDYFLFVGSDNDFITLNGFMVGQPYTDKANVDTLILVYRVTLPTYVPPHGSSKDH